MGDAPPRAYSEALPWHDPSVFEPTAREHHPTDQLHLANISQTALVGQYTDAEGRTRAAIYDLHNGNWKFRHGSEVIAPVGSTVVYHAGALHIRTPRTMLVE